jgi:hypothetical protein
LHYAKPTLQQAKGKQKRKKGFAGDISTVVGVQIPYLETVTEVIGKSLTISRETTIFEESTKKNFYRFLTFDFSMNRGRKTSVETLTAKPVKTTELYSNPTTLMPAVCITHFG